MAAPDDDIDGRYAAAVLLVMLKTREWAFSPHRQSSVSSPSLAGALVRFENSSLDGNFLR